MSSARDAVVVGAGIVGAACAHALAREGFRVLVLDAGRAGSGTTAAAMGHVVVMDDSEAQLALTAYSRDLWASLARTLGPLCEDEACGTLWVASDGAEMEAAERKARSYEAHGLQVELLTGRALLGAEPHLRPGLAGALLVPGDRVVYPPGATRALLAAAVSLGAEVREGWPVESLGPGRVVSPRGTLEAELVVNAAGAGAGRLMPGLRIEPRKGHLVITDRAPGFCRHQIVELAYVKSAHGTREPSVAFNVQPRPTGQVLIGSSREYAGSEASLNRPLLARMLRRAASFMPSLASLTALRAWVGFRPATPDGLPWIGAWGEGLFVAAGHEGLGVTTALGTARLIADLALGRTPDIPPAPYAPSRAPIHG